MQIHSTVRLEHYQYKYLQSQYTSPWTSRAERSKFFQSCWCFQISRYCFFLLVSNGISRTTPRNSSDMENPDISLQHASVRTATQEWDTNNNVPLQSLTHSTLMHAIIELLDWIYFSVTTLTFQSILPLWNSFLGAFTLLGHYVP